MLTKAHAGWYECYNFKGTIDNYSISFSIQVRDGYYGEQDKKHFNLQGVYKYDKFNEPIKLVGQLNPKTNKVFLYEINNKQDTAIFSFDLSETVINGTWTSSKKKSITLKLTFVSKLIDTSETIQFKDVQILQSNSLSEFYFVGVYSKTTDDNRAKMDKLLILKKKGNTLFQTIDFVKVETRTGNVMTIIFDNLEIADVKSKKLRVSNDIGRLGGYLTIRYNLKAKKFVLNPNPIAE